MNLVPAPDKLDLWKNRRRIAWSSLAGLYLILVAAIFKELQPANADLLNGIAYTFGGILLGYLGFVVADDVSKRKSRMAIGGLPDSKQGRAGESAEDAKDRRAAAAPAMEGD